MSKKVKEKGNLKVNPIARSLRSSHLQARTVRSGKRYDRKRLPKVDLGASRMFVAKI